MYFFLDRSSARDGLAGDCAFPERFEPALVLAFALAAAPPCERDPGCATKPWGPPNSDYQQQC
jgi:hypothetical protein